MRTSLQMLKWRDVPVFLHWSTLVALLWFYAQYEDLGSALLAFVGFFLVLLLHELGHAAVAQWRGVHVLEIRLFILHGYCRHEIPERPSNSVWIAWGGVIAQLSLFAIAIAVAGLLRWQAPMAYLFLAPLFADLIEVNVLLVLLNLIPVSPLDGAIAWRILIPTWRRVRAALDVRRWARNRKLKQQSKAITANLVERLKKGK